LLSELVHQGEIEATAVYQNDCFKAALTFGRAEAMLPAPESSHAIAAAVEEALAAKEAGEKKTILFGLSGHGFLDLPAYEAYSKGQLEDYDFKLGA